MSTTRIDNDSTTRINDDSTTRIDDDSTTRIGSLGQPNIQSSFSSDVPMQPKMALQDTKDSGTNLGEVFSTGQVVELNGKKYFIEDKISDTSGEAVIYRVSQDGNNFVLKYYKIGYDLPAAVIKTIKEKPKSKIVKIYDYGRHFEQNFEIMEYAQGGNLADYIKENGAITDINKLKNIVSQIAEGLEQLHKDLRIIYQDLKPENIYFKDAEKTSIILGDFGISNIMISGKNEAEVRANATKEYAAPELARIGNNTQVIVDPSVDYFALGITMMYLWIGAKPFQGLSEAIRVRQIMTKDVAFPQDIQSDYKILIQGLIDPLAVTRWGSSHVKKWIAGDSLVSDYQKSMLNYETIPFNESESFSSPEQLADLLEKYPDRGIRFLYTGVIINWLSKAQDHFNISKINDIITAASEDNQKISGVYASAYALNPDKPFVSHGKKKCYNYSEIASALMDEADHYMKVLKDKKDFFYLYLLATEGANGPIIAEKFHKYFIEYSPKRALTLLYLKLQDDDGRSISIGSKTYYDTDEIAAEQDTNQIELIKKAVMEKDSLFNVWLSDNSGGFMESTEGFNQALTKDRFYLLGKFPFLSYKELVPNWQSNAVIDLQIMTQQCPGRFDLFETYAKQGLPFNDTADNLDWQPTILSYLSTFFADIATDDNTKLELVKFFHKNGADLNKCSGDGSLPLTTAIFKRNVPLTSLLLQLGADVNREEKYAPIFWALCQNADSEDENIRFELANLLLDYNANVNIVRGDLTALILAITLDSPKKVPFIKRLLDARANVNKACDEGFTPLMYSINKYVNYNDISDKNNELEVIESLLKKKAKTEVLNKKGYWSPLMRAAEANAEDAVKLLLRYGAKKDFADADGSIAYVYAMNKKHTNLKKILDPGAAFTGTAALISFGKVILAALPLLWVFLTMDVLSRLISSISFSFPVLTAVTVLLSHLLTAYALIAMHGLDGYLWRMKRTFSRNSISKAFWFIVLAPLLFPIIVAALQFATKFLPVNINELLLKPMEMLTASSSGFSVFISYVFSMAIMLAAVIVFHKLTNKFFRKVAVYKQFP